jgi:replicative DNA helicase Mcm
MKKIEKFTFETELNKYNDLSEEAIDKILRSKQLKAHELAVLMAFQEIEKGEVADIVPGFVNGYRVLKKVYKYSESMIQNTASDLKMSGFLETVEKKDRYNILKLSGKGKHTIGLLIGDFQEALKKHKAPKEEKRVIGFGEQVKDYMDAHLKEQIDDVVYFYPAKNSVYVDYMHLESWSAKRNSELCEILRTNPDAFLNALTKSIEDLSIVVGLINGIEKRFIPYVRIKKFPPEYAISISSIEPEQEGRLISFEGTVVGKGQKYGKVRKSLFQCSRCVHTFEVPQELFNEAIDFPRRCEDCGKRGPFKEIEGRESEKTLFQIIHVQEKIDSLDPGKQADNISVCLTSDLVGVVEVGNKVSIAGALRYLVPRQKGYRPSKRLPIVEALSVIRLDVGVDTVNFTEKEIKEFKKFPESDDYYEKILDAVAPAIYGYRNVKEAVALQLFGGRPNKVSRGGGKVRSDIHLLLIGDPSTAKTEIVKNGIMLASKHIFTSGKGSSGCGLTATVGKDPVDKERWILKPGALPLANGGILGIDELDKMEEGDRDFMLTGMEQQIIPITKADIAAEMRCETAVLAAANPKFTRFDKFTPIREQFNITEAMLSRFDMIFPFFDEVNAVKDSKIADAILENHSYVPDGEDLKKLDRTFIQKYIAYAKKNCHPRLSDDVKAALKAKYVNFRARSKTCAAITARQMGGLIRMSEARAKMRLADMVSIADADRVFEIYEETMKEIAFDPETKEIDTDRVYGSHSAQDRSHIKKIEYIIHELCGQDREGRAIRATIESKAFEQGVDREETREVLKQMKDKGMISEPSHNVIMLVRK